MKKWKTLESNEIHKAGFFRLRTDKCELPDGRVMPRYYVVEFCDWVHVVPVTADGQVVMVNQYRHAADEWFMEFPGGATDPGEDPKAAALRELEEETGYVAKKIEALGMHYPNPAIQTNRVFTYLATGCELTAKPCLDPFEDLEVKLVEKQWLINQFHTGCINHALVAASLSLAMGRLS